MSDLPNIVLVHGEGSVVMVAYSSLPNKLVSASNGIGYAYRDAGEGAVPLVRIDTLSRARDARVPVGPARRPG